MARSSLTPWLVALVGAAGTVAVSALLAQIWITEPERPAATPRPGAGEAPAAAAPVPVVPSVPSGDPRSSAPAPAALPPEPSATPPPPSFHESSAPASSVPAPLRPAPPSVETAGAETDPPGLPEPPEAPGNSFAVGPVRIAVVERIPSRDGRGTALAVELRPNEGETSEVAEAPAFGDVPPGATSANSRRDRNSSPGPLANTPSPDGIDNAAGLDRDAQLFRMKWGWAAYDAALAEARRR